MGKYLKKFFVFGLERLQDVFLFFLVLGTLLLSYEKTVQGVIFERFVFFEFLLVACLFVWIVLSFVRGTFRIARMPIDGLFVFLTGVFGVSALFSDSVHRGVWGTIQDPFLGILGFASLCLFAFFLASTYSKRTFWTLSLALIASCWGIFGNMAGWAHFSLARGSGLIFSIFMVLLAGLFFVLTLLSVEEREKRLLRRGASFVWRIFLLSTLGILLFSLTRIFSDFFLLSIGLGLGVFLLFMAARKITVSRVGIFLTGGAVLFFIIFGSFGDFFTGAPSQERFPTVSMLQHIAWNSILDNPVLGYGPGLYEKAYALNKPAEVNQTSYILQRFSAGSGGLWEWISTVGSLGTILFLLIIAGCLGIVWYALKNDTRSDNRELLCFFSVWMSLLPILVWYAYDGILLFLFFLCIGALLGSLRERNIWMDSGMREFSLRIDPRYALVVFFGVIFVAGSTGFLLYQIGGKALAGKKAYDAQQAETPENSVSFLEKSVRLDPKEPDFTRRLGEAYAAVAMQEALKKDVEASSLEAYFNRAFEKMSQAFQSASGEVLFAESLARVYESASAFIPEATDSALKQYIVAESLEPNNPIFHFKQGVLLLQQVQGDAKMDEGLKKKKLNESVEQLNEVVSMVPNFSSVYYELALVYREKKEQDRAVENAKKSVEMGPNEIVPTLLLISLYIEDPDKVEEAKILLDRAETMDPDNVTVYMYLGRYYAKKDMKDAARDAYAQATDRLSEDQGEVKKYIEKLIQDLDSPQKGESSPPVDTPPSESNAQVPQEGGENVSNPDVPPVAEPTQATVGEEEGVQSESKLDEEKKKGE